MTKMTLEEAMDILIRHKDDIVLELYLTSKERNDIETALETLKRYREKQS